MIKSTPMMKILALPLLLFFTVFLIAPLCMVAFQSMRFGAHYTFQNYSELLQNSAFLQAFLNSLIVSSCAALITTIIAFLLAYTMHFTKVNKGLRFFIQTSVTLPMLLPTITYGFVLIYAFGNQGTLTQLLGSPPFSIYGFNGLLIGYILYTLPIAYVLMNNAMLYIDKQYLTVSYLMHDRPLRRFYHAVLRPMFTTIGAAFILTFILSFTDFGIPASVGGEYEVVAMSLYRAMLGAIVRFEQGAAIAIMMLIPAVIGILLLAYLQRYQVAFKNNKQVALIPSATRDIAFSVFSSVVAICIVAIFAVLLIVPFTMGYPYDLTFTLTHVKAVFMQSELLQDYRNSIIVASITALLGTLLALLAALLNTRTPLKTRRIFDWFSILTNTVPGMVLGLSYLFLFNDSTLKGTILIIVLCNIVHFFTTPYTMAKNALQKMDHTWEVTGQLMQDTWFATIRRVVLPNMKATIFQMLNYYFLNAMVTVSGVIFIVSTETMLVSTRIKELQHFAKYTDIFILSLFILVTNLLVKLVLDYLSTKGSRQNNENES